MLEIVRLQKVGSDAELAVVNEELNVVPCYGIIPGEKKNPYAIREDGILTGYSIHRDGFMAEFAIPPANNCQEFVENIQTGLQYLKDHCIDGHNLKVVSTIYVNDDQLNFPDAREFGCDPAYNVWLEREAPLPDPEENIRYCGGHVHVSYENFNIPTSIELVKILDLVILVPSIIYDDDIERRENYGFPGNMRFKDEYGFEYRSVSPWWLEDESSIAWIYDQITVAVNMYNDGFRVDEAIRARIFEAVVRNNEEEAKSLIKDYLIPLP